MADDPRKRGADIVLYEETDNELPVTRARFIRINGTEVGLTTRESVGIDTNPDGELRVTITFQPRSLTIHQTPPAADDDEPSWTRKSTINNP